MEGRGRVVVGVVLPRVLGEGRGGGGGEEQLGEGGEGEGGVGEGVGEVEVGEGVVCEVWGEGGVGWRGGVGVVCRGEEQDAEVVEGDAVRAEEGEVRDQGHAHVGRQLVEEVVVVLALKVPVEGKLLEDHVHQAPRLREALARKGPVVAASELVVLLHLAQRGRAGGGRQPAARGRRPGGATVMATGAEGRGFRELQDAADGGWQGRGEVSGTREGGAGGAGAAQVGQELVDAAGLGGVVCRASSARGDTAGGREGLAGPTVHKGVHEMGAW